MSAPQGSASYTPAAALVSIYPSTRLPPKKSVATVDNSSSTSRSVTSMKRRRCNRFFLACCCRHLPPQLPPFCGAKCQMPGLPTFSTGPGPSSTASSHQFSRISCEQTRFLLARQNLTSHFFLLAFSCCAQLLRSRPQIYCFHDGSNPYSFFVTNVFKTLFHTTA